MIGALSMLFGEVYAGSSNVWFLDAWGIFSTYSLYLTHIIFYVNLAKRWNRSRISHLYFFGALFALYEGPITQVLWSGYMNAADPPNIFLGISIIEFIVLVFFWHPVFSFVIPVFVYEIMVFDNSGGNPDSIFPGHAQILMKISKEKNKIFGLLFLMTMFQIVNSGLNLLVALTAFFGNGFIVLLLWLLAKSKKLNPPTMDSLIYTKGRFVFLILFMFFYVYIGISLAITSLLPGRWPSEVLPYLMIIGFAALFILLIKKSLPVVDMNDVESKKYNNGESTSDIKIVGAKDVYLLFFVVIPIGCIIFASFAQITTVLFVFVYFFFILIGFVLLIKNLIGLKKNPL